MRSSARAFCRSHPAAQGSTSFGRDPRLIGLPFVLALATMSPPADVGLSAPLPSPAPAEAALPASPGAMPQPAQSPPAAANSPAVAPPKESAEHNIIVVAGSQDRPAGDPFESVNAASFAVTQDVDRAVIAPVAMAYKQVVPKPLRDGLRNALRNINEPVIFLNFMLQLKPGKAVETAGRFVVNSTIGIAGLLDVAKRKPINLPRRVNGFAYTMGYYGIKPGPFFFVPLIGPTTLRDALGGGLDRLLVPMAVGHPFDQMVYSVPTSLFSTLNRRVEIDEEIHRLRDNTPDPYAAFRADYLERRQAEIDALRGRRTSQSIAPQGHQPPAPVPGTAAP